MTDPTPIQAPAAAEPATPAAQAVSTPPKTEAPKPGDPADAFKSEESKNAVLADLAKERDARQALEARLDAQSKAIAEAFGLSEAPKSEDLAETVKALQSQIQADRHEALIERLAATYKIDDPEDKALLTETDPEKLKAQAERVGALIAAKNTAATPPEFQPNPGQGQGGSSSSKEDDSYPSHWLPKKPAAN